MVERTPEQIIGRDRLLQLTFEGYAVVPVKPTQAMLDEVTSSEGIEPFTDKTMTEIYQTMVDVALRRGDRQ